MPNSGFLDDRPLRAVQAPDGFPFHIEGLALGKGPMPLEVLLASYTGTPSKAQLRKAWGQRLDNRPIPLLLVVLYEGKAALCGPSGNEPSIFIDADRGQVERICLEGLEQPDQHMARRALRDVMPALETKTLSGLRNEGFLASHELEYGVRKRSDWEDAARKAQRVLAQSHDRMLEALGYSAETLDNLTSVLRAGGKRTALAILLRESESPELVGGRFQELSPITYALTKADQENLPYVILQKDQKIRLYPVSANVGVGRRSRSETYIECHCGILRDTDAAYLWLLFSAEALASEGSLQQIIRDSDIYAGHLADRLRERIHNEVIPRLAKGIIEARQLRDPSVHDLEETYSMAMTLLFRTLFIAYAEDKQLLPYHTNDSYKARSLKAKAQELAKHQGRAFDEVFTLWDELRALFQAVNEGNSEWGVPAYDGGLFSTDAGVSRIGHLLEGIRLKNTVLGPALLSLLVTETPEGIGPVDFRSLGVREFGTIYEGLLEKEISIARVNLKLEKGKKEDTELYVPTESDDEVFVRAGDVYLHDTSGARKTTGSYFTKSFAVEHLLDRSLEPALAEHLQRLGQIPDDEVSERLLDFRVADIAMGSGHFLVAAIDRIEKAFTGFLAKRGTNVMAGPLNRLRAAAMNALGDSAEQVEIEDAQLLRRLIARRCIYGVDINPMAVQLAQLAVWIHTFVPGLPLSLLDNNLVHGNSLVGIGSWAEILSAISGSSGALTHKGTAHFQDTLLPVDKEKLLGDAREPLARYAGFVDATAAEIMDARRVREQARRTLRGAEALCDIITATRLEKKPLPLSDDDIEHFADRIVGSELHTTSRGGIAGLNPLHFPIAFPEVFLREREGFDVILGNPPWDEATLETDAFWARHFPGLRSKPQTQQKQLIKQYESQRVDLVAIYKHEKSQAEALRNALVTGPYPGMGTGDPDLYKAFCWRFWDLLTADGHLGVVLPRSALAAKGTADFRDVVIGSSVTFGITSILNNKQWFFEDIHPQYTVCLVSVGKAEGVECVVSLLGPFRSRLSFDSGISKSPAIFQGIEIQSWNDTASFPLLPSEESIDVFVQLRKSPRLDLDDARSWCVRPYRELDATNDKKFMEITDAPASDSFWPVYKGESFDIWEPDTKSYYAWGDPNKLLPLLQKKRQGSFGRKGSAFTGFDRSWINDPRTLPCNHARIAFRDVSRSTDTRTIRAALVPPRVFITNKGPYFLWIRGDETDQAYLLGILSSIPLDWYARRFVEISMNFYILNPFPIPRPEESNPLRKRVIELAGRLACPDERFAAWAVKVGVACGPIPTEEKEEMIAELDAVVAHLYGLNAVQVQHIFETFHEGWDYGQRLSRVLAYYRDWEGRA